MTKFIIIYVISERTITRNHLLLKNKRGLRKDKGDPINVILMAISKSFNTINYTLLLREKCPNTELFLVHVFLYSDRIRISRSVLLAELEAYDLQTNLSLCQVSSINDSKEPL